MRDEERQAWQRLVRVLSHELNNSLTPIKSIAASLLSNPEDPSDVQRGLTVISARAESLTRFMEAYTRLARLPRPRYSQIDVGGLIARVGQLERRADVRVEPGPAVMIEADGDQLEQLIINLVRNAVDAALETNGRVTVTWRVHDGSVEVLVTDEGHGLSGTSNLFVPFFTTKPGGTGIGLVLSRPDRRRARRIAEPGEPRRGQRVCGSAARSGPPRLIRRPSYGFASSSPDHTGLTQGCPLRRAHAGEVRAFS